MKVAAGLLLVCAGWPWSALRCQEPQSRPAESATIDLSEPPSSQDSAQRTAASQPATQPASQPASAPTRAAAGETASRPASQPAASTRAARSAPAQPPAPSGRGPARGRVQPFVAPDGSPFLLVPMGRVPMVFLATVVPCGVTDETPGLEGLAQAVVRASLNGTKDIGTRDWTKEQAAMEEEDRLVREIQSDQLKGIVPSPQRRAALEQARARARGLGDATEFERRLRDLGCAPVAVTATADGVRLATSFPAESTESVLTLMRARRDRPVLRGLQTELEQVREEIAARHLEDPLRRTREETLTLAFKRHPYRRAIEAGDTPPLPCDRFRALAFFEEYHGANRVVTALVGGFDHELVKAAITRVHADTGTAIVDPAPPPAEAPQEGERLTTRAPEPRGIVSLGFRIPSGTSRAHLLMLREFLAGDPDSVLPRTLVTEHKLASLLTVDAAFPGTRYPGLFQLDVVCEAGQVPQYLAIQTLNVLGTLGTSGMAEDDFKRCRTALVARRLRIEEDPESLAAALATERALDPDAPADLIADLTAATPEAVRRTAATLFRVEGRTVVVTPQAGSRPAGRGGDSR